MVLRPDNHAAITKPLNLPPSLKDFDFATKNLKNFLSNAGIFDNPGNDNHNTIFSDSYPINGTRTNTKNDTALNSNIHIPNYTLENKTAHKATLPIKIDDKLINRSHVYAGPISRESFTNNQSVMPFVNGKYIAIDDSKGVSNGSTNTNNKHNGIKGRKYVGNKFTSHIPSSPENHYALPVYMRAPAPKSVPIPKNLFKNR